MAGKSSERPLEWQEGIPCLREIFQAGPSRDRSTSIWLSLVALPRVIWKMVEVRAGTGNEGKEPHIGQGTIKKQGLGRVRDNKDGCLGRVGTVTTCLTSRERIRYRTMRPRNTARVWLSKSGELMPEEEQSKQVGNSQPAPGWGRQGLGWQTAYPDRASKGARQDRYHRECSLVSSLTCDAVHKHLPLMQFLLQLPDLSFLPPVSHCQL